MFEVDGYIINPYYANNIGFTVNPTIGTANTIQLAIDGLTSLVAPKASPSFTGIPAAPTAATGTSTTQLATTAFVNNTLGSGGTYAHSITGNSVTTSQTNFSNLTIGGSQVVTAANYNTYAPSLTGVGASGSWNISAAQLGGLSLQTASAAPSGSQVLRSDVSGHTYHSYINSSTPNSENPGISQVIVTNGSDNFYRKSSIASLTSAVQTNASGSWNITATSLNGGSITTAVNTVSVGSSGGTNTQFMGNVSNAAAISFNRAGTYGINIGLDTDNVFRLGGWSNGTNIYRWQSDTAGNFTASGNITAFSDARLKTNVATIENALDKVSAMRGVSFDKDGKRNIGVIAQEMKEVLPEVVMENADGYYSVGYGNIVGVLIEAIKELKAEIEVLKGNSK